jgi:hypothetical protein
MVLLYGLDALTFVNISMLNGFTTDIDFFSPMGIETRELMVNPP